MKILLDPGHGGNDPGAVAQGVKEEDIALDVVLRLGAVLRDLGHDVLFTRDRDTYISPADRLRMINDYRPECFVSVHCNASANPAAHGVETIYRDDYDFPLAAAVHQVVVAQTDMVDRGIKQDMADLGRKLAVLGNLAVPACLVEIGFISNEQDLAAIMATDVIAGILAEGIAAWCAACL